MIKLPDNFEEFTQARRNGFIKAKEIKESGQSVVGVFCTYTPVEIPMAIGASVVGLCGVSEEPIPEAEKILPRNLCPLIKSSYGHAITDTCPYFYFSDFVIAETTCDGKKKMYEELSKIKPMHIMHLPNTTRGKHAYDLWKNEIEYLIEETEKFFNVKITEENLREAVKNKNRERVVTKEFYELGKMIPPPISGYEIQQILNNISFKFDKDEMIEEMSQMITSIKTNYENGNRPISKDKPRILITGCPIGGVTEKIVKTIEDSGAVVVAFENCGGIKANDELVDESNPDIIDAIAKKYLNIPCSCMSPNDGRIALLDRVIDEYSIDGVVDVVLQACHTFNVESHRIGQFVTKEKNKPYISIETDYSKSDTGQLKTRFEAFVEMIQV